MTGRTAIFFSVVLDLGLLFALLVLHGSHLLAVAVTDSLRSRPLLLEIKRAHKILLLLPVVDDQLVLRTHHLPLSLHQLHLLMSDLICTHVIHIDYFALNQTIVVTLRLQALILLIDQVLGIFTMHTLLLTVHLKALLVREALFCNCPQHLITLPCSVALLHVLLLLLHTHSVSEVIAVLASLLHF